MKRFILGLLALCCFYMNACNESSVDSNANTTKLTKSEAEALIKNTAWVSYKTSRDVGENPNIVAYDDNHNWYSQGEKCGTWAINESVDSVEFISYDSSTSQTQKASLPLSKFTSEEFTITENLPSASNDSIWAMTTLQYLKVPYGTVYAIAGDVDNTKNLSLIGTKISVIWRAHTLGTKDYYYSYGKGEFRCDNTKFVVCFSAIPPDIALISDSSSDIKYGVAYISLQKNEIPEGVVNDSVNLYGIGMISDRAFVYVNREISSTDLYYETWLDYHINVGFNFAKGVYYNTSGVLDTWDGLTYYGTWQITLLVDNSQSSFKFPNWR